MRWRSFLEPASHDVDSYVAIDMDLPYMTLKLADCSQVITLHFSTRNAAQRRTARNKLQKLQRALDEVAAGIEEAS